MGEIEVEYDEARAIRQVTFSRPDKRNAMSRRMFDELVALFEAEPGPGERATVLRSVGPVFCSGIDLRERLEHGQPPLERLCTAIRHHALPVVVVVQGDAIAGGGFIALSGDFVVAAEHARFWFSLVQIGLAPPWTLSRTLLHRVGPSKARDLLLLGDPAPADFLADADAITSAVPADQLESEVARVVGRLAQNAPLSLRAIKATLAAEQVEPDGTRERTLIAIARDSEDGREGVRARLEKRMPSYAGR